MQRARCYRAEQNIALSTLQTHHPRFMFDHLMINVYNEVGACRVGVAEGGSASRAADLQDALKDCQQP